MDVLYQCFRKIAAYKSHLVPSVRLATTKAVSGAVFRCPFRRYLTAISEPPQPASERICRFTEESKHVMCKIEE